MDTKALIAVVDDEELIRTWLCEHLRAAGWAVVSGASGEEAERLVREVGPALMLLDLRLPDASGLELLPRLREIDPDLVVIMITAFGEIEIAVEAVKAGAYQFLQKPLDMDPLLISVEKALETRRLKQQVAMMRDRHCWHFSNVDLVGRSVAMRELAATVEKLARSETATVLLRGESGTGKNVVARAIHAQSERGQQPFVEINCTALPEHLVESELFGHERGAFTDARERKKGLAELADGGTLFLDEVGDMPPNAQAKLLRFLEDSKFMRLGGTAEIRVSVRVIAATNKNLDAAVRDGEFRNDLYYRLNVVPVTIPPLRERPEDVVPLTAYFLDQLGEELRRDPPGLTEESARLLERYGWPGNARELRNVLERIMILEETDEIRPEHLPREIHQGHPPEAGDSVFRLPPDGASLEDLERDLVRQAMARTDGNVSAAARLLGISRDTLRYRLEKYSVSTQSVPGASD